MRKMFYIVCIILMLCTACSSNTNSNNTDSELNNNPSNNQEVTEQVVYEDTYAKVVFQKLHEEPSIEGMGYIDLKFENKTDQEITIYPKDSAVNDTAVQYMSGIPGTMASGQKFNQSWFFSFENAGISELSEVNELSFSLWIVDENMNTLGETDVITVAID